MVLHGSLGKKLPTINVGLRYQIRLLLAIGLDGGEDASRINVQFMFISPDHKGKAGTHARIRGLVAWLLQRASRQERVVRRIERNGSELFPIPDKRFFREDFMERNSALCGFRVGQRKRRGNKEKRG